MWLKLGTGIILYVVVPCSRLMSLTTS